jgi:hypothetical protein
LCSPLEKIRKKGVKERVNKEKSKKKGNKREVERGCLAVCVTKSLISIISSWWWFWTARF